MSLDSMKNMVQEMPLRRKRADESKQRTYARLITAATNEECKGDSGNIVSVNEVDNVVNIYSRLALCML
jgi:hypothetical protein